MWVEYDDKGKVVINEVKVSGKNQVMQGFVNPVKKSEFHSKSHGNSLSNFKQECNNCFGLTTEEDSHVTAAKAITKGLASGNGGRYKGLGKKKMDLK